MTAKKPLIMWNTLSGQATEVRFEWTECEDHQPWEDEYDTHHQCDNCKRTDPGKKYLVRDDVRRPEYDAPTP